MTVTTTGKKLGFKKGDFVWTGAFPGIIVSDVHTFAPMCEVWGFEHEIGGAYATDLKKLTWLEFLDACAAQGYQNIQAFTLEAKKAIEEAQSNVEEPKTLEGAK